MSRNSHSAPGPAAGYGYQIERALYWLSRSPAGTLVGIETDDDVAVKNGSTVLWEQDKHSINAGAEPFGDRSKDLWNTLAVWLDAIEDGRGDVENMRFLMVTNKELPDCIAKKIGTSEDEEAAGHCIAALERAAENPPEKIKTLVGRVLRSESHENLVKILVRTDLVDAAGGADGPQLRLDTRASLQLPTWAAPYAESIANELAGWVYISALTAWRDNKPAWIHRDHFIDQFHAILGARKRRMVRERAEHLIPITDDEVGGKKGRLFVRQLFLVTEDDTYVNIAIRDFIRCGIEKLRLSSEGNVTDNDWRDFEATLRSRWERICARISHLKKGDPLEQIGFEILTETVENYRERLAGTETDQTYLTSGTYHLLADLLQLGWHPEYSERLNQASEEPA